MGYTSPLQVHVEDSDSEQAPKWVITALDANPLPVPAAHRPTATGGHLEFALPLLAPFYPGLLPVWAEEGWRDLRGCSESHCSMWLFEEAYPPIPILMLFGVGTIGDRDIVQWVK